MQAAGIASKSTISETWSWNVWKHVRAETGLDRSVADRQMPVGMLDNLSEDDVQRRTRGAETKTRKTASERHVVKVEDKFLSEQGSGSDRDLYLELSVYERFKFLRELVLDSLPKSQRRVRRQ